MEEWTDEFIAKAQSELKVVVADWKYDYGASDEECATMLVDGHDIGSRSWPTDRSDSLKDS